MGSPFIVSDLSKLSKADKIQVKDLKKYIDDENVKAVQDLAHNDIRNLLSGPRYQYEDYPLHLAARKNSSTIVKLLVKSCPEAVIQTNSKIETPIHIAINYGNRQLVKTMFPYFRHQIMDKRQELPGESLVHAVLRKHRHDDWKGYFKVLFGRSNVDVPIDIRLKEQDYEELEKKLMYSYRNSTKESPLSWLILNAADEGEERVAYEVAKEYPQLMQVYDDKGDKPLPIHHAFRGRKMYFLKKALKEKKDFYLGINSEGKNILHLLALDEDYCKNDKCMRDEHKDSIFQMLTRVKDIYNLVRQKGIYKKSPLELAAENRSNDERQPKTNDTFITFSIIDAKPTT